MYNYYDHYDYGYNYGVADSAVSGLAGFFAAFVAMYYLLLLAYLVVNYVLQSLGMYAIAKRRSIHRPWLAWVPVGNMWLLGSISDQYQYVAKGRVRNRRKLLLGLTIAMYALIIPGYISFLGGIIGLELAESGAMLGAGLAIGLVCLLVGVVIAIIAAVFQYIALYDLFASCDPGNAVLYLVLSIFLGVTLPFFVFFSRKKDLGMPPRRQAQPAQQIQATEQSQQQKQE